MVLRRSIENRPIWPITVNGCNAMNQSKLEGTGAKRLGVGCDWLRVAIGCDWLGVVNPVIKLTEHNLKVSSHNYFGQPIKSALRISKLFIIELLVSCLEF